MPSVATKQSPPPVDESQAKNAFSHLLSPIRIGNVQLKNRIALSPMNETLSDGNGRVTEQLVSYFAARAKGGTGLLVTGAVMATRLASQFVWGRNLSCYDQGHLHGLSLLTDRVHYFGALIAAQMSIGFGRQGHSYDHHHLAPAATAGLPYEIALDRLPAHAAPGFKKAERTRGFLVGQMTREMTIDEIRSEQKEYAASCQLALMAGFDAIEIHAPHGYLEHQFLSPLSNKRTDMYGGEWRNRKRFLLEVMEQIRYACPGACVGVRISAEEHIEGGLTRAEMIDVAQDLEARGADYISLSDGGGYEEADHLIGSADRAEHIPSCAREFKKALKIPVIVASQHDPVKADEDIGAGKFDVSGAGAPAVLRSRVREQARERARRRDRPLRPMQHLPDALPRREHPRVSPEPVARPRVRAARAPDRPAPAAREHPPHGHAPADAGAGPALVDEGGPDARAELAQVPRVTDANERSEP